MKILLLGLLIIGCSTEPEDCFGVIGGTSELDDCGVCDSNSFNNCLDCSTYFNFFPSSQQAFYYFENVMIDGFNISAEDVVAAFNGDICVGKRNWDTSVCGGGVCDVPVYGYDGNFHDETFGYMLTGDIPTFKIYDVSEGVFYSTTTTDEISSWQNIGTQFIPNLEAVTTSASSCQYIDE